MPFGIAGQVHAGPLGSYRAGARLRQDARGVPLGLQMWSDYSVSRGRYDAGDTWNFVGGDGAPAPIQFQPVQNPSPDPLGFGGDRMPGTPPNPSPTFAPSGGLGGFPAYNPQPVPWPAPSPMRAVTPAPRYAPVPGAVEPMPPMACTILGVPCWMAAVGVVAIGAAVLIARRKK
jgi:hypothetical protein